MLFLTGGFLFKALSGSAPSEAGSAHFGMDFWEQLKMALREQKGETMFEGLLVLLGLGLIGIVLFYLNYEHGPKADPES